MEWREILAIALCVAVIGFGTMLYNEQSYRHNVQLADQAHHYEIESLLYRQAHEKEMRMFKAQVRTHVMVNFINGIDFLLRTLLDYLDGGEVLQRLQRR